jgi:hypothetical protein
MTDNGLQEMFGEVISSYSRKQAIEDGVLVELPEDMRSRFKCHVAMTSSVHALCVPPKKSLEDYKGRVWDVLTMYGWAAKLNGSKQEILFKVKIGRKLHILKAHIGPGDAGEPVVTIMQRGED